ncbi:hypothetical protein LTR36_010156 [Oleoguttula mirabilis]|uniref:Chitin biosynthesis protein CHS5 n=1 Tax=Oleoguttula mirabilis TaxID=1507867 RepID=A0AAV9JTC2_9PEZI|nr:hypothetical protein LTR36_010156 [Oleoguttula mirabilis]
MLVSLTVGKVDAGVAVLLTEDKRLIEFPSILLPPDIHSGSIVDINVARNQPAEHVAEQKFAALQADIYNTFGTDSPQAPVLRCRNATQTSVVLEWDPIELATAEIRSLSLYRNGSKAGNIPAGKMSTKISGLALDTEYTFHLVLRTSAGQYASERLTIKTHKMTDLHGITITPGVMPSQLKDSLAETVNRIGAKLIDGVRIDTTHFVCTEPRGQAWEKAVEMNVPVVVPDWLKGCEREGRIVGVRSYYLDADPSKRQIGPAAQQQQQQQQRPSVSSAAPARDSPRIEHTPPTPERPTADRSYPRANGARAAEDSEPPTPPPKPVNERVAEEAASQSDGQSMAGTTLAEKHGEDDDGADGDESDGETEQGTEDGVETEKMSKDSTDGNGSTEREPVAVADDDGNFDEVAL